MNPWAADLIKIMTALLLVLINGFFVAVEFALVKLREGQLHELIQKKNRDRLFISFPIINSLFHQSLFCRQYNLF